MSWMIRHSVFFASLAIAFWVPNLVVLANDEGNSDQPPSAIPADPEPNASPAEPLDPALSDENLVVGEETPVANNEIPEAKKGYRVSPRPYSATIFTNLGNLCCDLFIADHPLTVLNFKTLATGSKPWTDKFGRAHDVPYYNDLAFGVREKDLFVATTLRQEGTNFVVPDERCSEHQPVAGAIAMVQPYPGRASTQFVLLAKDLPQFIGMYTVFGQCSDVALIQKLTRDQASIAKIEIAEGQACQPVP